MTTEDFNEEEFQIIASSDQLFEDIPLTRIVINDLEFGFECNECQRFSTRTASERERVESINHQPWCKTAFLPALLGLLGIGAAEGAGAAAAGAAAAGAAEATAAGAAGAAAGGAAAGAAEGAALGAGTGAALGAGAAETAAAAPALAEGAGATSLVAAGESASPGLMSKAVEFAGHPVVQQGLRQYNQSQAQKQQELEQQKRMNELARQSSANWGRVVVSHAPGKDIAEGEFAGATFVGREHGQSKYVFDDKTGPWQSFNKHQFSICDGCGEVYHPPHRPENKETGHVEWQSRNLGHHASSHFYACPDLQRHIINNPENYPKEYETMRLYKTQGRRGSGRVDYGVTSNGLHRDLTDEDVAKIPAMTRSEYESHPHIKGALKPITDLEGNSRIMISDSLHPDTLEAQGNFAPEKED